jgi:MFS transporter, ACS family, solute carrier family 17 (sodium-dependent inorganic phosphate cotransporter), other
MMKNRCQYLVLLLLITRTSSYHNFDKNRALHPSYRSGTTFRLNNIVSRPQTCGRKSRFALNFRPEKDHKNKSYRDDPLVSTGITPNAATNPSEDSQPSLSTIPDLNLQGYIVLIMLFFVTLLSALDRVAMSVAIIPMGVELSYDETTKGIIAGLFSIGYMFGLLPAGILGSFYSPKDLLSVGVALWSLAQMMSPFFATISLPGLYICRFAMGVAEACTVPTVQAFVARWVKAEDRSKVLGIILSGFQLGTVGAYLGSPIILKYASWAGIFVAFGMMGFLWIALWYPFAADYPNGMRAREGDGGSKKEKQWNEYSFTEFVENYSARLRAIPWRQIVDSKQLKAIAIAHGVQNFGLYINLAWLPSYFNQQYGLSTDQSALSSVGPWVGGAILGSLAGYASDKLEEQGFDRTKIRISAQSIALTVPAITLLLLSTTSAITAESASVYFVTATASAAICVAGFGSSIQDICKSSKLAPILYGITSVPAVLMGSSGVYLTGLLLDSFHNWNIVFQAVSLVYLLGALYYATNYTAEKSFD